MELAENIRPLTDSILQKLNTEAVARPLITLVSTVARAEIRGALWWPTGEGIPSTAGWRLSIRCCEREGLQCLELTLAKHPSDSKISSSFVRWTDIESVEESYAFDETDTRTDPVPVPRSALRAANVKTKAGQRIALVPSETVKVHAVPDDMTAMSFIGMVADAIAFA